VAKGFAHDHGRVRKGSLDVAVRAAATEEHVARHVFVQEDGAPRERCLQTGDRGKRLVFDLGQLAGIGRLRRTLGTEGNHRLAYETDALGREGSPRRGPEALAFEPRRERSHPLAEIFPRERRCDTRRAASLLEVDASHVRVGMGTPHESCVKQPGQPEVVEIGALPREETRVFDALDALTG